MNKEWKDDKTGIQILMLDIDNSIKEGTNKENIYATDSRHITTEKIVEYSKKINLEPTFIYSTFSHTAKQNRLRMVYVLEEPVKNAETVKLIYEFLLETFKSLCLDESTIDISRMFLGGKEITYSSDKCYKVVVEEEKIELTEIEKYSEMLSSSPYFIKYGTLWREGANADSPVSNFLATIKEQVNYNNGRDIITDYKICGILIEDGRHLPIIRINKQELENFNFVLNCRWKLDAVISAGIANKDRMREVTQLISKSDVINKNVFAHTGFVKIDEKLVYLYHGGIIGDVNDVEVDLSDDKLQQYCFTSKEIDVKEALATSFSILDLASEKITIPLLATTYLAPLTSILKEEDINADYILWIEGKTGTRKSSVTAMILSHFGNFSRNSFPCSFRDTLNSLEKKAFILKDCLNTIDDYNPENFRKKKIRYS